MNLVHSLLYADSPLPLLVATAGLITGTLTGLWIQAKLLRHGGKWGARAVLLGWTLILAAVVLFVM